MKLSSIELLCVIASVVFIISEAASVKQSGKNCSIDCSALPCPLVLVDICAYNKTSLTTFDGPCALMMANCQVRKDNCERGNEAESEWTRLFYGRPCCPPCKCLFPPHLPGPEHIPPQ